MINHKRTKDGEDCKHLARIVNDKLEKLRLNLEKALRTRLRLYGRCANLELAILKEGRV